MALKDRFVEAYNALVPDAWKVNFRESAGATIDVDEANWRPLSADVSRDLSPLTQQRMQKMAHYLWESNLLANRLVELPVAYLLAEGVKLSVKDEENQKVLDRFWSDPINDMDLKLAKKVRELSLFGEQIYPAFVNTVDGMVRIGYLDPQLVATVVMDPDNPEQPIGVVTVKDKQGRARKFRVIINGPEDVFTARTQAIRANDFPDGECFYFRVNDLSSGARGRSDLLAQADWLDAYDQFLFGELDRYAALRSFIWDVTLKGATPDEVKARAKEIFAPKPGSVRVHNDSEAWSAEAPDLKAADTAAGARLFRNHVLGGATMPEHWFGGGGDVNRAVGAEMAGPTFKMYSMRQRYVKHMLESIGRYVLWRSKAAGGSAEIDWSDEAWRVTAIFPELSSEDTTKYAAALQQVVVAANLAVSQGRITEQTAVAMIGAIAGRLGVEFDAEKELEAARKEGAKRNEDDNFTGTTGEDDAATQAAAAAMQEAVALMADWQRSTDTLFATLREAADAAAHEERGADKIADAIAASVKAQGESNARLVEALGSVIARQEIDVTIKHGSTRKTIKTPDGRAFTLEEAPADEKQP